VKPVSIVSERQQKINDECRKTIDVGKFFILNYLGRIV
jgi:hypothetical protein